MVSTVNSNYIMVDNKPVTIKEYDGRRVLTLKDIDALHNRNTGTASRNFKFNREKLVEGKDYFVAKYGDTKANFEVPNRGVTIFTSNGYSTLVKSFNDDSSKVVCSKLMYSYFGVKPKSKYEVKQAPKINKAVPVGVVEEKCNNHTLQLRTTSMFNHVQANIYGNDNGDMFMTARQLGECLGYSDSMRSVNHLVERNPYLMDEEFSCVTKLVTHQGNRLIETETRVFNEDGIYEVTFLSNTSKALEFRRWVRQLLKSLRTGAMSLVSQTANISQMISKEINSAVTNLKNEISVLEVSLRPQRPDFYLWKKTISIPAIDTLSRLLKKNVKETYNLVYDAMTVKYGFDKSFAVDQFCKKYGLEEGANVIDAIADSPEYQYRFTATATSLINKQISTHNTINSPIVDVSNNTPAPQVDNVVPQEVSKPEQATPTPNKTMDKVQETIQPLIELYDDKSFNGAKTYGKVYDLMKTKHGWKTTMTRNHCYTKKAVILKNEKLFKQFSNCVQQLLSEYYAVPTV